jgi:hypothetical protein
MPKTNPQLHMHVSIQPHALRPDTAAAYAGVTPFRVEQWLREGLVPFIVPPGSDTRIILVSDLDKFLDSLPKQSGKLAGRGRFSEGVGCEDS